MNNSVHMLHFFVKLHVDMCTWSSKNIST